MHRKKVIAPMVVFCDLNQFLHQQKKVVLAQVAQRFSDIFACNHTLMLLLLLATSNMNYSLFCTLSLLLHPSL